MIASLYQRGSVALASFLTRQFSRWLGCAFSCCLLAVQQRQSNSSTTIRDAQSMRKRAHLHARQMVWNARGFVASDDQRRREQFALGANKPVDDFVAVPTVYRLYMLDGLAALEKRQPRKKEHRALRRNPEVLRLFVGRLAHFDDFVGYNQFDSILLSEFTI